MLSIIFYLLVPPFAFGDPPPTILRVGEEIKIGFVSSSAIFVEPEGIISVEDLGNELKVRGIAAGLATIKSDSSLVAVRVLGEPPPSALPALIEPKGFRKMFGPIVRRTNQGIEISGQIHRMDDWVELRNRFSTQGYSLMAEVDRDVQHEFLLQLTEEFAAINQLPPPITWSRPVRAALAGNNSSPDTEAAKRILRSYGIKAHIDTTATPAKIMIRTLVKFVEVKKSASSKIGFTWPSAHEFQILPQLKDVQSLTALLEGLSTDGLAKVLASPSLITNSGSEASFVAGGEFPVPIRGRISREVVWKKYGVSLKVRPNASLTGRIDLHLSTEISSMDEASAVDGIPGVKTNTMDSSFNLLSEQTLAISGLVHSQSGNSRAGIAGLSDIPILGALFSSQSFLHQESEMMIFVTPEIVTAP